MSQVVTPDSDFALGQDVLYTDDCGNQERLVYEGATPDGQWHTLRKKDTSKIVTPSSNVKFLVPGATRLWESSFYPP